MAQKPEDRYANATEFREALRRMGRANKAALRVEREVAGSAEGAAATWPAGRTVHIREVESLPDVESQAPKLALVASARQFGPAGATAVLAVIVTLAGGILYGAQHWFPATDKVTPAATRPSADTFAALRQQSAARKPERPRASDSPAAATAKSKTSVEVNNAERPAEKRNELAVGNSQSERRSVAPVMSAAVSGRGQERANGATRKNSQRPGAPSIRLPNPEFRDNTPGPTPSSRFRNYGAARPAYAVAQVRNDSANAPPKFYRAADGTQIVKFSDGSTRVVRPARSVQSGGSYR
jgi:hypothetical protein